MAEVSYYGHDAAIRLHVDGTTTLDVTSRVVGQQAPQAGEIVGLKVVGAVMALAAQPRQ